MFINKVLLTHSHVCLQVVCHVPVKLLFKNTYYSILFKKQKATPDLKQVYDMVPNQKPWPTNIFHVAPNTQMSISELTYPQLSLITTVAIKEAGQDRKGDNVNTGCYSN